MKKKLMMFVFAVSISIFCLASSSVTLLSKHLQKKHGLVLKETKELPWGWYTTEVTFYLTCGVWAGDVTQWSNHYGLTSAEFATAWRFKNYQLCGVWVPD